MVTLLVAGPPPEVALQVKTVPVVSVVTVLGPQPVVEVTLDSGSLTVQETVTLDRNQPSLPRVPDTLGVMTGGVVSKGGTTWNSGCALAVLVGISSKTVATARTISIPIFFTNLMALLLLGR
jgi:hypothetical protein